MYFYVHSQRRTYHECRAHRWNCHHSTTRCSRCHRRSLHYAEVRQRSSLELSTLATATPCLAARCFVASSFPCPFKLNTAVSSSSSFTLAFPIMFGYRYLQIFLLHIAMSVSSPTLSPVLFKSRWHVSFHLVFGRPLFPFEVFLEYPFSTLSSVLNTFLSMCSLSLLITSSCVSMWSFWQPVSLSLFLGCVSVPSIVFACHSAHSS